MKRCSMLLLIRAMQIKTMKFHFTPTRMAVIKQIVTSVGEGMQKLKPSYFAIGIVNWDCK